MTIRVAINGFGRIGRLCLRSMLERHKDQLSVVALNDMADLETSAHLFQYDSTYGRFPGSLKVGEGVLQLNGWNIAVLNERDPARLPWKSLGVDLVIESTGVFADGLKARSHLDAGAKKIIVTAPAKNVDVMVVLGVNDSEYDSKKHRIVSNASCTTNCLAPVVKTLHDAFGIEGGLMTTTHAYTNDQRILDLMHKDLRRARAAGMNIVPTTTGAAQAIGLVIPELHGKLDGISLRVPTSSVSVVDIVVNLKRSTSTEEINAMLKKAASSNLKGIMDYTDKPLVSSDFRGHPASAIIDGLSTMVLKGKMAKVLAWYDNEWGYSCRVADLAVLMSKGV
ncbi:MAG: type I glyceraldehyde-3-phosphate dehydrogenase [Deltaproteobacteria bacterium]|nr:type I glyceraldehyde-3-phosphate dehydrogenase [Deltaproteobacteria bacterium]MCH7911826.1 type I glyceraldehyde-3-phosphate dehydrogenase [Deltaproteobacteria bacterium]